MTRFIFVRVGALLLIIVAALFVAYYFITQSLNCIPVCINVNLMGRDMLNADLSKTDFTEASLQGSDLSGANLRWADLSGAQLNNTVFANADMRGAKLIGADLRDADLRGAKLDGADLSGAVLNGADMTQLDLTHTRLAGVSLIGTKLVQADLTGVILAGIDISSAELSGANLTRANLSGSSLSRADLSGAILIEADMAGTWLNLTNLTGVNLTGGDLSGASMIGTNLASANLGRARLIGASAIGALFLGTDLRSASLQGIRLVTSEFPPQAFLDPHLASLNELQRSTLIVDATLRGVQYNDQTQWPQGKLILLAGLLGQAFAEEVATQEAALPTPEPTPVAEPTAEAGVSVEVISQPETIEPPITFALGGPGKAFIRSLYDIFQSQGYTDTIGFREVEAQNSIRLLCESSEVDAILIDRRMSASELEMCSTAGYELIDIEMGTIPLVFIVNPANTFFTDIAFSEIPLLFSEEKWDAIRTDWPGELIMRFFTDPESSPLTRIRQEFFADSETDPIAAAPNTLFNPNETQLVQAVSSTPDGIGIFSLNIYLQNAEILQVATIDGVVPNTTTVASGAYSLTQPLMFYANLARIQEKPEIGYFLGYDQENANPLLERAGFVVPSPDVLAQSRETLSSMPTAPVPPDGGEATPEAGETAPQGTPTPEAQGEATPIVIAPTPQLLPSSNLTETLLARLTATAMSSAPIVEATATGVPVEESTATPAPP
jgi:uncharacterized protein YjbI with pentapeptide repeats/ABC-type phosphate transport system substrate-binding protein